MSFRIFGIGEILWDLLPSGPQMGGAPANFAYHARALGANASVVTRVGPDRLGCDIQKRLHALGLPEDLLQVDDTAPTGTVTVELAGDGVPKFTIHTGVAWDRLLPTEAALKAVRTADAICFGSLGQREEPARSAIQTLVGEAPLESLRIFDINLRQHFYSKEVIRKSLELATVFKLNDAELPIIAELFSLDGDVKKQIRVIAERFDLDVVALTRGADGSLLYEDGRWSECPSQAVKVVDTVGAGDAFTAALAMGLLNKMDLDVIHSLASQIAGYVCSQHGATPALPARFREKFAANGGCAMEPR